MKTQELKVYVDASSRDDGRCFYGYVIQSGDTTIAEGSGYYSVDKINSVAAEHVAADLGYRVVKLLTRKLKVDKITLFTDEENIVKEHNRPRSIKATHHEGGITQRCEIPIEYRWIPSKENIADKLVSNPERRRKDAYFRSKQEGA